MENKYYTPSLEEFFIGFEFEVGDKAIYEDITEWTKDEIEDIIDFEQINHYQHQRVKYLDREDIESLGFENIEGQEKWSFLWGAQYRKSYNEDTSLTLSVRKDKILIAIVSHSDYEGYDGMYFNIKNKSELKKLLQQLEVYGDN